MGRKPPKPRDLRQFMKAFLAYLEVQPWESTYPDEPVGIRFPDEEEPWFAVTLGREDPILGLHLARGTDGLHFLRFWGRRVDGVAQQPEHFPHVLHTGFVAASWHDVPRGQQGRLQRAKIPFRRDSIAPDFRRLEDGQDTSVDAGDVRRLAAVAEVLSRDDVLDFLYEYDADTRESVPVVTVGDGGAGAPLELGWEEFDTPRPTVPAGWETPPRVVAPPPELAPWRDAEARLDHLLAEHLGGLGSIPLRLRDRYFGPAGVPLVDQHLEAAVGANFHVWLTDYAQWPPSAPTVLEEVLRNADLSEQERRLAEARSDALPSFHRVEELDPEGGWVVLADLLTGETHRLHDGGLARSARTGMVFGAKLVPAGDLALPVILTPPILGSLVHEAFELLESLGLELTPHGLDRAPHLLGRLWEWTAALTHRPPPRLVNSEGHDLVHHTLGFSAHDPDAVAAALDARDDLDRDEDDNQWTWYGEVDPQSPRAAFGDRVVRGHVELIGDELVATVNSDERADEIEAWLDRIPGVEFVSDRTQDIDPTAARDIPLDDRASPEERAAARDAELPPELVASVHANFDEHYRTWPDIPLPALDGQTPREAAATPEGARKVARLVRTFDAPLPDYDIAAARRRILDDLGIE